MADAATMQASRDQALVAPPGMLSVDAMKAVAVLLITQSHLKDFYPTRAMATGGLLGNTLFFFAAGVLVALSLRRRSEAFLPWYGRRLLRVYLPLWIVGGVLAAGGVIDLASPSAFVAALLVPADYWFLPAIAALYPACWVLGRINSARLERLAVAATLLLYAVLCIVVVDHRSWNAEDHLPVKTTFYFAAMAAGLHAGRPPVDRPPAWAGLPVLVAATAGFFGYLALLRATGAYGVQFGAQFLALASAAALFRTLRNPVAEDWLLRRLGRPVRFIARLTLPLYLVQMPLIAHAGLERLPFPANLLVFAGLLVPLAWLLEGSTHWLAGRTGPRRKGPRHG